MKMAPINSILIAIFITTLIYNFQPADAIVNTKIDRIIDLSSQLVKITERITLDGEAGLYIIKADPTHRARLAFIGATINGQPIDLTEKVDGSFEADLVGKSISHPLVVTSIYTKILQPYPAEITQSDRQLVRYEGLQTTLSPYLTKQITTKIKLPPSSKLESFTKASKMTTGSKQLTYGPFKDVQPNQAEQLSIHYENNSPFVAVTDLKRTIELSPWANSINIVNEVQVTHIGSKLKGPFSRFEYQRDHTNGMSSVRHFLVELPKTSRDIYFRDGIGNISTSTVKPASGKTIVNIKPRFPLFGGWMTDFNLGYRVPMGQFVREVKSSSYGSWSTYELNIPYADVLYENMFIEDATVKIYLPAGAKDIEVKRSIQFQREPDQLSYSYLDVIGRPVVVLRKQNIVAQHLEDQPLVIRYNYNQLFKLQEPLLLLAASIAAFVMATIYSKMTSHVAGVGNKVLDQSGKLKSE